MTSHPIDQISAELSACRRRLDELGHGSHRARMLSRFLGRLDRTLRRPPRIVLLGEFNAGKSTLANALIGREVLPTSIHANTRVPLLIHYGAEPTVVLECHDHQRHPLDDRAFELLRRGQGRMLRVGLPVADLQRFELIDTPGLASGVLRPDTMVMDACRHAHIAVWCTRATQAWKASEQAVWQALPHRLKRKGLLVATGTDLLHNERDRERLQIRLALETIAKFSALATIATAEADEVRRSPRQADYGERWQACGGKDLEALILGLVDREVDARATSARRALSRAAEWLSPPDRTAAE